MKKIMILILALLFNVSCGGENQKPTNFHEKILNDLNNKILTCENDFVNEFDTNDGNIDLDRKSNTIKDDKLSWFLIYDIDDQISFNRNIDLKKVRFSINIENITDKNVIESIQTAINYWNFALKSEVFTIDNQNSNITFCYSDYKYVDESYFAKSHYNYDTEDPYCLVRIGKEAKDWWQIYVHELGHCLGLEHSDNENSIMFFSPNKWQRLTVNNVSALTSKE